jgi:hypothetical protein
MLGMIQTFFSILKEIEKNGIDYMVVGSMASTVYGEPRMTHDLDVVIQVSVRDVQKLEDLFRREKFYCPPLEVLRSEIVHHGQFNLIHYESGLKVDLFICKETEHALCEFKRRRRIPFWNENEVYLASPEDIILKKLEYFRQGGSEKHLKDIKGILAETELDDDYLNLWVVKLGLEKEWQRIF